MEGNALSLPQSQGAEMTEHFPPVVHLLKSSAVFMLIGVTAKSRLITQRLREFMACLIEDHETIHNAFFDRRFKEEK